MSERRVLMTTDAVGGVWVFAAMLARAFAERNVSVHLVVIGPRASADRRAELDDADGVSIVETELALEWQDPEGRDMARARTLLSAITRRIAPDVVHLNGFREACYDWPAPTLVTAHSCVLSWWQAVRGDRPSHEWSTYADHVRQGLAAADAWTAPTTAMRDEIVRLYTPPRGGDVILNGIERERVFAPRIADRDPVVLAAGRLWDEAKNVDALAAVAPHLPWPVRVIGPTRAPSGEAFRGTSGGIEVLGELPRARVLQEMSRASIFAAPARYEPFGLGVLEAAASGAALVLADIPSFREVWNGSALFVDPDDTESLRDALCGLIAEPARRLSLADAAARRARDLSIDTTVAAYLKLYDDIVGPSSVFEQAGRYQRPVREVLTQ